MYDYIMSLDETQRGNMFTNLYILGFEEVPDDSNPAFWADAAY